MLLRLILGNGCKMLLNTNAMAQKIITNRGLHVACRTKTASIKKNRVFNLHKHTNALAVFPVRHGSTESSVKDLEKIIGEIPDAPIPETVPVVAEALEKILKYHPNGEVAFESIGLGGYYPKGIIQSALEALHIGCGLQWWAAIAIGTVVIRLAMFPIVIKAQRNSAKMSYAMPKLQVIQEKMTEAKDCGNEMQARYHHYEMMSFWKTQDCSPFKSLYGMIIQVPVFISVFAAMREMAALPVESLKQGGMLWFTDLTVPDPYYLLPLITCGTLYVTMSMNKNQFGTAMKYYKYAIVIVPIVVFPCIMTFPGHMLCYWVTSNFLTLLQCGLLQNAKIRKVLDIPDTFKPDEKDIKPPTNVLDDMRKVFNNVKTKARQTNRSKLDAMQFANAARAAQPRTFKYDPTKPYQPSAKAISTKKR